MGDSLKENSGNVPDGNSTVKVQPDQLSTADSTVLRVGRIVGRAVANASHAVFAELSAEAEDPFMDQIRRFLLDDQKERAHIYIGQMMLKALEGFDWKILGADVGDAAKAFEEQIMKRPGGNYIVVLNRLLNAMRDRFNGGWEAEEEPAYLYELLLVSTEILQWVFVLGVVSEAFVASGLEKFIGSQIFNETQLILSPGFDRYMGPFVDPQVMRKSRRFENLTANVRALNALCKDVYLQAAQREGIDETVAEALFKPGSAGLLQLLDVVRDCGFPFPKVSAYESLVDCSKPNVAIIGLSANDLVLARELDRSGEVNVIVVYHCDTFLGFSLGCDSAVVYTAGELYHVTSDSFEADYVFSADTDQLKYAWMEDVAVSFLPSASLIVENKEIAAAFLRKAGLEVPRSIVFKSVVHGDEDVHRGLFVDNLVASDPDGSTNVQALQNFLADVKPECVVVKPVDGGCGEGVKFFFPDQFGTDLAAYIDKLLCEGNVIVEERIESVPVVIDDVKQDWNLRVMVSRDETDRPKVCGMFVRIDKDGGPVNLALTARAMTFENLAGLLGWSGETLSQVSVAVERLCISAFDAVTCQSLEQYDFLRGMDAHLNGQVDLIGMDVILTARDGQYVPVMIEMNGDNAGGLWYFDHLFPKEQQGSACRDLAKTMIRRARAVYDKCKAAGGLKLTDGC